VIKVEEKRPARTRPLAEVRGDVRARLATERAASAAEERARALAAELAQAGTMAKQKLLEAGSRPGVQLGVTEPFQAQGMVAPLGMVPAVNAAAFSLPQGGVSEALRTQRGWVVLRVEEVRAPRLPELAEVAARVRGDVEQDRLRQLALARLQTARQRVEGGASLEEVASELGLSVQETAEFGHGQMVPGIGVAPELVTAALAAEQGALGGPLAIPGRAVLYRVSERKSGDPATMVDVKKGIREDLEREQVNALLAALINARKQELGVTYDPALVQQLGLTPGEGNQS
jgi:peptidyl-prolyl cis-trans isomerase D